jgi:hypothetical protein
LVGVAVTCAAWSPNRPQPKRANVITITKATVARYRFLIE